MSVSDANSPRLPGSGGLNALSVFRCRQPSQTAKCRAGHEAGTTWIVVVEQAAHQLAGRVQAGNGAVQVVLNPALAIDLEPAEGEGDAARNGVTLKRRLVDAQRPVGFWRVDANG